MCDYLPFSSVNNEEFSDALLNDCRNSSNDTCNDQHLKDILFDISKNENIKNLNNEYISVNDFNAKFITTKHSSIELSLLHLNIHSLNAKLDEFCHLINNIEVKFDVVILSEIWCTNINFFSNVLPNYTFHYELPVHSKVGGVGVFINKALTYNLRADLHLRSTVDNKVENLWYDITKNKQKFIIGGIYRHPCNNISEFTDILDGTLGKIVSKKTPCIIAGDLNVDLIKADTNNAINDYLTCIITNNFLPTLLLPTRITARSSTLIDHIYVYNCLKE